MNTKTVYAYDENYKYIGEKALDHTDVDPYGNFNIPGNCTEVEPPATKTGFDIIWTEGAWEYREIPEPTPEPEPTLEELKERKLQEVSMWTAAAITGGFISDCAGTTARFDSDQDTQITMQGIALNVNTAEFAAEYPDGCPVRGYADGTTAKTVFMLEPAQVLKFCADMSKHIGTQKQRGWELQQAVAAAQTADELDEIMW